jgi:hypothetical protein
MSARSSNLSLLAGGRRIRLGLVATLAVFLTPITMATTAGAAQTSGFGDPLPVWQAAFPSQSNGCNASNCYGPTVPHSTNRYEFSYVTTAKGRVDGFDIALRRGTPLLRVQLRIAELFPADAQMGSLTVIHRDSQGNSCAVFNMQSKIIERIFGKRAFGNSSGTVGVELAKVLPNGTTTYNRGDSNLALVVPTYLGSDTNC